MHRRILSLTLIGFLSIVIINWGCTKIDTTNLGGDLIPEVDNVTTFADTLRVDATQKTFDDTTIVVSTDYQALGNINNDPLFGKTTAHDFFQLKPASFPFAFGHHDSLVGLDSVVLCLSYKYFWGDSTAPQKLQVFEVTNLAFADSPSKAWYVDQQPTTGVSPISDPKVVDVRTLANYMKYSHGSDSVNNQIRIKLYSTPGAYGDRLFNSDSSATGSGNHAFFNDSIYRRNFNGLAVKAIGTGSENGLMYINLADTNTKIEVHYRLKSPGRTDTLYKSFTLVTAATDKISISSTANYIKQDRSGKPAATPQPNEIYLQTQPGTYANLSIPDLSTFPNSIIHRAELIIEQIPTDLIMDSIFSPPNFMYLDLKEPGTTVPAKYKPIYLDLNLAVFYDPDFKLGSFYPTGGPDFTYFGGYLRKKTGPLGGTMAYYNINMSRYVQQMVTKGTTNYELRLFPAYRFHYPQYDGGYIGYNNNPGYGRIRVGSGDPGNVNYRMRLRIVYSKIK